MENKFYIKKLDSYEKASEISKIRMGTESSYDLDLLPSVQMQKEMRKFLKYRGQQLGAEKFYTERRFYHHLCKMLQTRRDRPESFLDWDKEKWKQQMKIWLLQQGLPLTEISKSHCGNETVSQAKTLHYIDRLIDYFLDLRDADVDEMTKDVWQLEKLDIQVKQDLTRTTRIINFKEISQQDLREEVKKAIYFQLKTESIGTVKKEMTAIRRFSRYLKENNKEVDSCSKLDRKIMEEYFYDDLSLGEIAENTRTSRQAVYDLLRRVEQTLEKYESRLHLLHQDQERQFRLRGAVKLLEACRTSDSTDPRLEKVEDILKSIIDESR